MSSQRIESFRAMDNSCVNIVGQHYYDYNDILSYPKQKNTISKNKKHKCAITKKSRKKNRKKK